MLASRTIAPIGAGIGGLAVATALAQRGARVTLFEQASEITEVGAGLQISPNGVAVLDALGLDAESRKASVASRAVVLRDYRRSGEVLRLDLAKHAPGQPFLLMHRADLVSCLTQGARQAGVDLRVGGPVAKVTTGASPTLHLQDGSEHECDLIVAADGLHSVGRTVLNGADQPFFTGQVAWRALVAADGPIPAEAQIFMAPHRHLVTYPLRDGRVRNIVAVQERASWARDGWAHQDTPYNLRNAFADFGPEPRAFLDQVEDVFLWGLFRYPVARHWVGEGLALVGDAAHPTLPFLAQGGNLALEDAWVLTDCLDRDFGPSGLQTYQDTRRDRAQCVISAANRNAWKYHVAPSPIRWIGHQALATLGRVAPGAMVRQFDWIYRHDVTASG